jgi:hypothetical protein
VLLAAVVVAAVGWVGWRHHQHQHAAHVAAADASVEALLARTTTLKPPLIVDRTYTACHGGGDLCVTSSLGRDAMVTALKAQLGALGITTGTPACGSAADLLQGQCQLTGNRDGAKVNVIVGVHDTPYWARPDWAIVAVMDSAHGRSISTGTSETSTREAATLIPAAWHQTPCKAVAGVVCARTYVRVSGSAAAATTAFARRLERLGFGVDYVPDRGAFCRSVLRQPRACTFSASRDYFKGGERSENVFLMLKQTSPTVATGMVWVAD